MDFRDEFAQWLSKHAVSDECIYPFDIRKEYIWPMDKLTGRLIGNEKHADIFKCENYENFLLLEMKIRNNPGYLQQEGSEEAETVTKVFELYSDFIYEKEYGILAEPDMAAKEVNSETEVSVTAGEKKSDIEKHSNDAEKDSGKTTEQHYVVLTQNAVSEYDDKPYASYHFPHIYRTQISEGDKFIYYGFLDTEGEKVYYGSGTIQRIRKQDEFNYVADLSNTRPFLQIVPRVMDGQRLESIGRTANPAYIRAIRELSREAYERILELSGGYADKNTIPEVKKQEDTYSGKTAEEEKILTEGLSSSENSGESDHIDTAAEKGINAESEVPENNTSEQDTLGQDISEEILGITGEKIREEINEIRYMSENRADCRTAFASVILKYVYDLQEIRDRLELISSGKNDSDVDFAWFDDDEQKVILSHVIYNPNEPDDSQKLAVILTNMYRMTVRARRRKAAQSAERSDWKDTLKNLFDRLPDSSEDNYEYHIYALNNIDAHAAKHEFESSERLFPIEAVSIYTADDIDKEIRQDINPVNLVRFDKVVLDKAGNYLEYESDDSRGIMCNILSTSLSKLYDQYAGAGLFDLNIRKYIRSTLVDTGINKTLDSNRENFWFLNNGITIACRDFYVDGNTVKIEDFSIVNGGQTTTLISTYKGNNHKEFYIPCKIVAAKNEKRADVFFNDIAEATNSQKPIYARDLKSNSPEMLRLSRRLAKEGINLEIKRGIKQDKKYEISIKNDEFGQLILSFVGQRPGTARSGKKSIFENRQIYDQIFKVNYFENENRKHFLLDILHFYNRYCIIEKELRKRGLSKDQLEIVKNGKLAIVAGLGVLYRVINKDVSTFTIIRQPRMLADDEFVYGRFISEYHGDDIDLKIENLITKLINIIRTRYDKVYEYGMVTSVSNFLKTDNMYYVEIAAGLADCLNDKEGAKKIYENASFLKRK